jgi:hypothetical protein
MNGTIVPKGREEKLNEQFTNNETTRKQKKKKTEEKILLSCSLTCFGFGHLLVSTHQSTANINLFIVHR